MAKAKRYLDDIIAHRQSIVFRRYCGLVVDNLYVSLIQVNLAQKQHRHIDTYMSSPCHSELFLLEKEDPMKKEVRKRVKRSESRWGR
ncbi:60S ribosomal protein L17-2 [Zea mays]|uniref:60S ribosomal protein L17-2 n=1 Tax=Zea mays TaxID=4577 RepID=A0A1Q1CA61_MAIZE|nr:60S ribosomal protein L17-2 [Zea mays]